MIHLSLLFFSFFLPVQCFVCIFVVKYVTHLDKYRCKATSQHCMLIIFILFYTKNNIHGNHKNNR